VYNWKFDESEKTKRSWDEEIHQGSSREIDLNNIGLIIISGRQNKKVWKGWARSSWS